MNVLWHSISFSRGASRPQNVTHVSCFSCIDRWIFYHCASWVTQPKLTANDYFNLAGCLFAHPWLYIHYSSHSILFSYLKVHFLKRRAIGSSFLFASNSLSPFLHFSLIYTYLPNFKLYILIHLFNKHLRVNPISNFIVQTKNKYISE